MQILMTADTVGGVWRYAVELARMLGLMNVQVALATKGRPLSESQRNEALRLPTVTLHESRYRLEWMADPWDDVRRAGRWLLELADRIAPDIVHLNDYAHGILNWDAPVLMVGHSCVLSWHEAVRGAPADPSWRRYRAAVTAGLQHADLVVAPTQAMLECLRQFYGPLPCSTVIPNGCDPRRFRPGEKRPVVFSAGRLWDEAKNFTALVRIARRIAWPVELAGLPHPDGKPVRAPGVTFLGTLSPEEMAAQLARTAIYALPARYEPFGLSILEAALSGCALVLGDVPSLREIWGDAACYVPPDDDDALADALNTWIDQPKRREEYAARAHARASELTVSRMASDYLAAYCALIERNALRSETLSRGEEGKL